MHSWTGAVEFADSFEIQPTHVAVVGAAILLIWALYQLLCAIWRVYTIESKLIDIPSAPGGNILIGHVLPLLKGTPWNIMAAWVQSNAPLVRDTPFPQQCE